MRIGESLRSSFKSLAYNKLRSFLTMLGIIIGIFSVIMLTSIGEDIKEQVTSQVESLGANLLYVFPGKVEISARREESKLGVPENFTQTKNTLTYEDVLALKGEKNIAAVTGVFNGTDYINELDLLTATTGVDEDLAEIKNLDIRYGRFISQEERKKRARVAVIGHQANKELFGGKNSVGDTFKMNGKDYKVVGILKYKKPENMGPGGEDLNIKIYLPITEMLERNEPKNISQILARASSADVITQAEQKIVDNMRQRHKKMEFTVLKQQDMLNVIEDIIGILTVGLGGIAAISLVVGGIGIMNIMPVSVTERTREIGIRKAIGATRRDIMIQFLIESVFLSIIGGIFGLALGIGGSRLLPSALPQIETALSIPAVIIAITFALLVGVFFGVYPATKAAGLDPIDALRSE